MRLRRPLPAVQGDTLHIVGVGYNRIGKVRRMNFSNRLGFTDDEFGPNLFLRLPVIGYSGSAESSRQRLLSRDYIDYVSSSAFMGIVGGCIEASASSDKCDAIREQFLKFLLSHAQAIEVTFRELENGSFELINNQIAYATLSPGQYESISKAAPNFEGKVDGETIKASDEIVWEFRGDEPIPTKAQLHLVDEQRLRFMADVLWYERMPVEDTARKFVSTLDYFPLRIADRRILPLEEFRKWGESEILMSGWWANSRDFEGEFVAPWWWSTCGSSINHTPSQK